MAQSLWWTLPSIQKVAIDVSCWMGGGAEREDVKVFENLSYASEEEAHEHPAKHTLDLYVPIAKKQKGSFAKDLLEETRNQSLAVFIHGGMWTQGDKRYYFNTYAKLASKIAAESNSVVAVVNYRLSPTVRHPNHVVDVFRSLLWLYENVESYCPRVTRDNIFLIGHSAGAHIATLLNFLPVESLINHVIDTSSSPSCSYPSSSPSSSSSSSSSILRLRDPFSRVLSSIRGVVSICGVYDLKPYHNACWSRWLFVRDVFEEDEIECASPIHHVRHVEGRSFLLLNAQWDFGLQRQTSELRDRMRVVGYSDRDVTMKEYKFYNHFSIMGLSPLAPGNHSPAMIQDVCNFIRERSPL